MKIIINARFLTQPVSGVQRYGIECSRKIKKLYPQAVFVTPPNIWNKAVAEELNATVIGTNTGHTWEQIDLPRFLVKQGRVPLFNPCNTAPILYGNNYITLHDLAFFHHPEWNSKMFHLWYNYLIPRIVRKSRHLFTVSQTVSEEIQRNYSVPGQKISVTYNGISEVMLAGEAGAGLTKENIMLAVGSFNVRKNHHSLIKAFLASDIKSRYKLVLVGDKNKVFSETGIDENELSRNNIVVLKNLPEADLVDLYRKADIVVSLSAYEGFGIPVLEGIFSGCKVVCSDIPVYKELYSGYAVFCDPFNIEGIISALNTAAHSQRPGAHEVEQLVAKYDYEIAAKTILDAMLGN